MCAMWICFFFCVHRAFAFFVCTLSYGDGAVLWPTPLYTHLCVRQYFSMSGARCEMGKVRMRRRNKVSRNTIPNPNILCLYITQVISYIRNKNLSYFPFTFSRRAHKVPKMSTSSFVRRSGCSVSCFPLFASQLNVMRAHVNTRARAHTSTRQYACTLSASLSSTSTLFMCYIH